jgi:MFS family permease
MPAQDEDGQELDALPGRDRMEEEVGADEAGPILPPARDEYVNHDDETAYGRSADAGLDKRTVRKLDLILLPFLAVLFLLNSLDKSNVGNAETAGFTRDAGLSANDLNVSLAFFFAFFVALQPVGAALGRKYGMARWVPACMSLWGLSTILHIWVRRRWQLICLRVAIASLEAGFYPTTVSYLSLFYTKYEFAVRLGFFYGQTAVAGALGGVLSWAVFSHFKEPSTPPQDLAEAVAEAAGWKSWEVLFLIEGCTTMVVAVMGFFWLPHSADTAWFFAEQEKQWAEQRIKLDRKNNNNSHRQKPPAYEVGPDALAGVAIEDEESEPPGEAHHRLLDGHTDSSRYRRRASAVSVLSVTADAGLTRQDILSAILNYKIWHLLICNILSAIPATAFGVFLPLVMKQLSPALHLSAAASNLLAAPPFLFGAVVMFLFMRWSDRSRKRIIPILWGLGILALGLSMTVLSGMKNYVLRYISLCILLSGSFIASPLTVAWLTNNTPEPGKRAILLGLNGWGNLAGVFSALLFTPDDESSGYLRPFVVTLVCVVASFAGFIAFWYLLVRENRWREQVTNQWTEEEREREELLGDVPIPSPLDRASSSSAFDGLWKRLGLMRFRKGVGWDEPRRGDEKLTFRYGL